MAFNRPVLICEKETTSHLQSSVVHNSVLSQQLLITEGSILENNLLCGNSWSLIVKTPWPYSEHVSCRRLLESLQCANSENCMQTQVRSAIMVCRQVWWISFALPHSLAFLSCPPVLMSFVCLQFVYVCVCWAGLAGSLLLPSHLHTCFRSAHLLNKLLQYLNPDPHSTPLLASSAIVCLCSRFIFSCLPEPCVAQLLITGYKLKPILFDPPVWSSLLLPIPVPTSSHHT